MPVVAVLGASIGASIGGSIIGGVMGSVIGGAIGGGLGGGLGSVTMGGSFSDGFKSGAIGGALGGAIGGYFGSGASSAEFAAADAAQLAQQGLSSAQIAETLGYSGLGSGEIATALESIGMDAATASSYGDYGLQQYEMGGISGPTDLSSIGQGQSIGMDGQPFDMGNNPLSSSATTDGSLNNWFTNNDPMGLEGTNTPGMSPQGQTGTSLSDIPSTPQVSSGPTQLSDIGSQSSIEGVGSAPTATANPQVANTSTRSLSDMFKGSMSKLIPTDPKQQMQLGMAGMQTVQDYMNAQKLQEQADAANQPYKQYMDTINNPDKYWDQYLADGGSDSINKASRSYAKTGRTGILPSLYTQQRQDFMQKTLPGMRQGLQGAGTMASANMQQQMYPMAMRQRGSSYIPQVLSSMYYKGGK